MISIIAAFWDEPQTHEKAANWNKSARAHSHIAPKCALNVHALNARS